MYLASKNIGALWFGIGKTEEKSYDGMDFVIMIAIAKMPADKVVYYNRIDIGIFLLFLELCFAHEGINFERKLFADAADEAEMVLTAECHIANIE